MKRIQKSVKYYMQIIGLQTPADLENFYKTESYEGESLNHLFVRYTAFLKRWNVIK